MKSFGGGNDETGAFHCWHNSAVIRQNCMPGETVGAWRAMPASIKEKRKE